MTLSRNRITVFSFIIIAYFTAIFLLNEYNIDFVLLGVIKEIFTIPLMIAQVVFLIIGIRYLIINSNDSLVLLSVLLLFTYATFTIGSFIM